MKRKSSLAATLVRCFILFWLLAIFLLSLYISTTDGHAATPDSTLKTCWWQPNTEPDLAGYRLRWRCTSAHTWQDSILVPVHPPRVAFNAPADSEICIAVVAVNLRGSISEESTIICTPTDFRLGDINLDRRVDMWDLLLFNYLISVEGFVYDVRLDFSPVTQPNGIIDLFDKLAFLEAYNRNSTD